MCRNRGCGGKRCLCGRRKRRFMRQNDEELKAVIILANGYETGDFRPLYSLLSEDCVWQSQWRFDRVTGRKAVIDYYQNKGKTLRESGSSVRSDIMELLEIAAIKPGSSDLSCFLEGKLCVLTAQEFNGEDMLCLIVPSYNEAGLLSRIDVCMPGCFRYRKMGGAV